MSHLTIIFPWKCKWKAIQIKIKRKTFTLDEVTDCIMTMKIVKDSVMLSDECKANLEVRAITVETNLYSYKLVTSFAP